MIHWLTHMPFSARVVIAAIVAHVVVAVVRSRRGR